MENIQESLRRFEEVSRLVNDPQIQCDAKLYGRYIKEYNQLNKVVGKYRELTLLLKRLKDAQNIVSTEKDPELVELAKAEIEESRKQIDEIARLLENDLLDSAEGFDTSGLIMEIRAGVGGEEACLFAGDLLRMYTRFAERKKWKIELVDSSTSDLKGSIKEAVLRIDSEDAYHHLKYESGTHRVQRVPATEASGRIHTSAATVAVLPQVEDINIEIKPEDLIFETCKSGGAGGQYVNKTESAVRLTHKPTGIVVRTQVERNQHRNRDLALKILKAKLYEMETSRQQQRIRDMRQNQIGTGDRSEKIRTYNFQQNRVTDHRINFTVYKLQEFLDGDLDEMVAQLRQADRRKKLDMLIPGGILKFMTDKE